MTFSVLSKLVLRVCENNELLFIDHILQLSCCCNVKHSVEVVNKFCQHYLLYFSSSPCNSSTLTDSVLFCHAGFRSKDHRYGSISGQPMMMMYLGNARTRVPRL